MKRVLSKGPCSFSFFHVICVISYTDEYLQKEYGECRENLKCGSSDGECQRAMIGGDRVNNRPVSTSTSLVFFMRSLPIFCLCSKISVALVHEYININ